MKLSLYSLVRMREKSAGLDGLLIKPKDFSHLRIRAEWWPYASCELRYYFPIIASL